MRILVLLTMIACSPTLAYSQDWKAISVPASPGAGKKWQLLPQYSDDFNYKGKDAKFKSKWNDRYHNRWTGPGLTEWASDHSTVSNGKLEIKASRKAGTKKVHCGVVTHKQTIKYPVYMEISMKVSGLVLSSNFWLLSRDDRNEIDVNETYGSSRSDRLERRMSCNYHIFKRHPQNNSILANYSKPGHYMLPDKAPLRDGYHRFGCYWRDPFHLEFYLDGKHIRTLSRTTGLKDPQGKGMDRSMVIIIDTEDHAWRSQKGIVATDAELANDKINTMYVDWVRFYRPVPSGRDYGDKSPKVNKTAKTGPLRP